MDRIAYIVAWIWAKFKWRFLMNDVDRLVYMARAGFITINKGDSK